MTLGRAGQRAWRRQHDAAGGRWPPGPAGVPDGGGTGSMGRKGLGDPTGGDIEVLGSGEPPLGPGAPQAELTRCSLAGPGTRWTWRCCWRSSWPWACPRCTWPTGPEGRVRPRRGPWRGRAGSRPPRPSPRGCGGQRRSPAAWEDARGGGGRAQRGRRTGELSDQVTHLGGERAPELGRRAQEAEAVHGRPGPHWDTDLRRKLAGFEVTWTVELRLSGVGCETLLLPDSRLQCHVCEIENSFECTGAQDCRQDEKYCTVVAMSKCLCSHRAGTGASAGQQSLWAIRTCVVRLSGE